MNPDNRMLKQVNIENAAEADYIFSMLMGEDVGPRRKFINLSHILHRTVPAGQGKPAVGTSLFLHLAEKPRQKQREETNFILRNVRSDRRHTVLHAPSDASLSIYK